MHFNGAVIEWQLFWGVIMHAVHTPAGLMNAERFHYLISNLVGKAARTIERIQVTDSSFADAMKVLNNCFRNMRIIYLKYLKNLRTLKPVRSSTHVTTMRNLLDTGTKNVRGLKALGRS